MKKFLPVWDIYRKLYIGCSLLLVVQKTVVKEWKYCTYLSSFERAAI